MNVDNPSDEKIKERCDLNEVDAHGKWLNMYFKAMNYIEKENKKHGYALRIGWFSFIAGLALSMIGSIMRM